MYSIKKDMYSKESKRKLTNTIRSSVSMRCEYPVSYFFEIRQRECLKPIMRDKSPLCR